MKIIKLITSLFRAEKTTSAQVLKIQKEGAEIAIAQAKLYNLNLDYSDNSIKKLDNVLDKLNKEYLINNNCKTKLENLSIIFGLYIIEVFERNHGKGYLERRLLASQEDTFPYYWKGNIIFPCIWCLNKIFDTKSEEIWNLYKTNL